MNKAFSAGVCFLCILALSAVDSRAQAPTGTVAGVVTDESEAVIPNARVTITNRETGLVRSVTTEAGGTYSAPALPAGAYEVKAEAAGFQVRVRMATVITGSTTQVDFRMKVGAAREVVTVEEATGQLQTESFKIDGVIQRMKIENLPLNGRSFLQLAFLEPGVTVGTQSLAQYNAQFGVSILGGASSRTAITVDGGNVRNSIEGQTQQNFSQEVVQEFQISTANFDLSTGITSVGSINIVTRSGSNEFHGSGYFFFRDHNISAYPHLKRASALEIQRLGATRARDPFFARRQSGFWFGGPIKRDRAFFFFNLEHINQDRALSVLPDSPFFANLAQLVNNPYTGKQISPRFDVRLSSNHNLFLRYSHDGNNGFGPNPQGAGRLPSTWLKNTNWADQSLLGLTSTFRPTLVNDFRFTYGYWQNRNLFPAQSDCPGCVGLGFPEVTIVGTNVTLGNTQNATQGRDLRRYHFADNLTWQRASHRFRFGGEIEHAPGTGFWGFADPGAGAVWGPDLLRSVLPGPLYAAFGLPSSFNTMDDILKLPLFTMTVGIGDPSQPPPYGIAEARQNNRYHLFWQDTWRIRPRFTLNYGLAWSYESTLVNHDLDKPAYLAPILGANGLKASDHDYNNISPSLGFAWSATKDSRTVIRAGAGLYYDTQLLWQRLRERALIGPLGNGRIPFNLAGVPNPLPGIPNLPGLPQVTVGTPLEFRSAPTGFTLGHLMSILPAVRAQLERQLVVPNPTDLSVRGIEVAKTGADIIPRYYPLSYSEHVSAGVQREIRRDLVVNADFVYRQFIHEEIGLIDYNRFNRVQGPVMPRCVGAQAADPKALCSRGVITVRTPAGRTKYKALLVKVDKRFSNRYQFTASYALQERTGLNGIVNLDNWFQSWGPQGSRHVLNISGMVDLPWKFQASFISAIGTRGPVMPEIPSIDLNGDGTSGEPLPGAKYNGFNRGLGKDDLARLVAEYNQTYAGKPQLRGPTPPVITLPAQYEFGDNFYSQDLRLTKTFQFHERYKLAIIGEVFNLFNIANLGGYSSNLTSPVFGQPNERAGQVFGSGGPRAFQFAARFTF